MYENDVAKDQSTLIFEEPRAFRNFFINQIIRTKFYILPLSQLLYTFINIIITSIYIIIGIKNLMNAIKLLKTL